MKKLKYSKELLETIVLSSTTFSDVVRTITGGDKVHGGMISYFKKLMLLYEIKFDHFIGSRGMNRGLRKKAFNKMTKEHLFECYLTDKPSRRTCNNNIKNWLFDLGIKEKICDNCKCDDEWMNQKLVLQLDHIDGNNSNNKIENLRILCPNCHSQTHNYAGRKNKNGR